MRPSRWFHITYRPQHDILLFCWHVPTLQDLRWSPIITIAMLWILWRIRQVSIAQVFIGNDPSVSFVIVHLFASSWIALRARSLDWGVLRLRVTIKITLLLALIRSASDNSNECGFLWLYLRKQMLWCERRRPTAWSGPISTTMEYYTVMQTTDVWVTTSPYNNYTVTTNWQM